MIKLENNKKIYLVGIGGVSMSAIGILLKSYGNTVSGYDEKRSIFTDRLKDNGIEVDFSIIPEKIKKYDIICYSYAISKDNPLLVEAIKRKKCLLSRDKMLSLVSKKYNNIIAVSGSHGKSTATSIISYILHKLNFKPTVHLGADFVNLNTNVIVGEDNFFITEACEYKKSFLQLLPDVGIILNVDLDHTDCYNGLQDVQNAFEQFALQTRGFCLVNGDDEKCGYLKELPNIITFGLNSNNDCYAKNIKRSIDKYEFDIYYKNKTLKKVKTLLLGDYNIYNVLAAYLTANLSGVLDEDFKKAINDFHGIKRRFEKITVYNGANIICDYAHHPKELSAVIELAKQLCKGKLYCVFQPHTYTRTKSLFNEFVECFSGLDEIILCPIYAAREVSIDGITSAAIVNVLKNNGTNAIYIENVHEISGYLKTKLKSKDIVLILGAGDINEISKEFV